MSEALSPLFRRKQQENVPLLPQVVLDLPMSSRFWGFVTPIAADLSGVDFDAGADFDADVFFDGGIAILEISDRLVSVGPIGESSHPVQQHILGARGQAERASVQIIVRNDDRAMSDMIGREYVLQQSLYVYFNFPNTDWSYALRRFTGHVARWTLTSKTLTLEAETL